MWCDGAGGASADPGRDTMRRVTYHDVPAIQARPYAVSRSTGGQTRSVTVEPLLEDVDPRLRIDERRNAIASDKHLDLGIDPRAGLQLKQRRRSQAEQLTIPGIAAPQ